MLVRHRAVGRVFEVSDVDLVERRLRESRIGGSSGGRCFVFSGPGALNGHSEQYEAHGDENERGRGHVASVDEERDVECDYDRGSHRSDDGVGYVRPVGQAVAVRTTALPAMRSGSISSMATCNKASKIFQAAATTMTDRPVRNHSFIVAPSSQLPGG